MYQRAANDLLADRLRESRRFLQVVLGPRQVGKTTSVRQVLATLPYPWHYATADTASLESTAWIEEQWDRARLLGSEKNETVVLALDEIQKIPDWSSWVKRLWDEDSFLERDIRVVLTGSSPLLVSAGLTESLAGRFETIPFTHWTWPECRDAFGWDLDRFVYFGGYPGAAPLIDDEDRWRSYILDSIVETTVSRDVLLMTRVDKPALLRRVFELACAYAGRELTYEKMVGALHDAGNTTTVAHYLDLLDAAGLVGALPKYSADGARRRRSTPKLVVHNAALSTAVRGRTFQECRSDPETWGRLVEIAAGATLIARMRAARGSVFYWRARVKGKDLEVDYVTEAGGALSAFEVKTGARGALEGLDAFGAAVGRPATAEVVGPDTKSLERFFGG